MSENRWAHLSPQLQAFMENYDISGPEWRVIQATLHPGETEGTVVFMDEVHKLPKTWGATRVCGGIDWAKGVDKTSVIGPIVVGLSKDQYDDATARARQYLRMFSMPSLFPPVLSPMAQAVYRTALTAAIDADVKRHTPTMVNEKALEKVTNAKALHEYLAGMLRPSVDIKRINGRLREKAWAWWYQ